MHGMCSKCFVIDMTQFELCSLGSAFDCAHLSGSLAECLSVDGPTETDIDWRRINVFSPVLIVFRLFAVLTKFTSDWHFNDRHTTDPKCIPGNGQQKPCWKLKCQSRVTQCTFLKTTAMLKLYISLGQVFNFMLWQCCTQSTNTLGQCCHI